MYIKTLKVIYFVIVIQVLHVTVTGFADFGVKLLISKSVNETDLVRTLEKLKDYEIAIPEKCKMRRFCENIPNYPEEIMTEIIERLGVHFRMNMVNKAPLAVHWNSSRRSLCHSVRMRFVPLAIADEAGKWVLVVNSKVNPVQTYDGETCSNDQHRSLCKSMKFQPRNHGQCMEIYVRKKFLVLNEAMNLIVERSHPLPSCCMCEEVREPYYEDVH